MGLSNAEKQRRYRERKAAAAAGVTALHDDEKGLHTVKTPGGPQEMVLPPAGFTDHEVTGADGERARLSGAGELHCFNDSASPEELARASGAEGVGDVVADAEAVGDGAIDVEGEAVTLRLSDAVIRRVDQWRRFRLDQP